MSVIDVVQNKINIDRNVRSLDLNDLDHLIKYPQDFKSNEVVITHPVIKKVNHKECQNVIAKNIPNFNAMFYKDFPMFDKFDFSNILIAGGCITSILSNSYVKDVDIFFYGLTPEQATNRLIDIIEHIEKRALHTDKLNYAKNKYTLNVKIEGRLYQFIFRCYKSISQILHGFDIASSAIGFDGKQLYTTAIGDFAFSTGYNIIDLTKRSPTYEQRLSKYFKRGFSIIMPNLDLVKLRSDIKKFVESKPEDKKSYQTKLGRLIICYSIDNMSDNCIITNDVDYDTKFRVYELPDYTNHEYILDDNIYWNNIIKIVNKKLDEVIYTGQNLIRLKVFNSETIIAKYAKVMKHAYQDRAKRINAVSLAKLNPDDDIGKIVKWMLADDKESYDLFIEKRILDIKLILLDLKYEISWITKNPGDQKLITSSISPMITEPKEWYGEYYIDRHAE